jgi:hypothetical protein
MYSRSYGFIEGNEKNGAGFSVPPDYHGNLYRAPEKKPTERIEIPEDIDEKNAPPPSAIPNEEKKPPSSSGMAGGFLERLTAEDILLFIFLFSLIRGDTEDNGNILGLILALLLL